ncbi:MAG: ABC transporter permease [Sphingobacteriales bacterium JAD_PAG50586_3]|nr:MAG: ABC transporter permease [Sphingobacteriales bacterium JAD_PAG50586_3]
MLFIRLFFESFGSALNALVENKLRTFLSLLGIVIGIFSIISVFTMVDALNKKITDSVSSLGDNIVYVQKWPWEFGADYPWWKYMSRPLPKLEETDDIRRKSQLADGVCFSASTSKTLKYGNLAMGDVNFEAVSDDYDKISTFDIADGRYFTDAEQTAGRSVCIIGPEIVENLFPETDPLGKVVSINGTKMTVIGIFKREGDNMFGNTHDSEVLVPVNFGKTIINITKEGTNPFILVKAKPGVTNDDLIAELEGIMRSIRRIKPAEEQNFALNQTSLLSQGFAGMLVIVYVAGGIIGLFSIIVGGFGIANIMFVSVTERTNLIGIKKSLGAKNYFILLEFLFEAIILCLIGGLIGLLLIYLLTLAANSFMDAGISLTLTNIVRAITISGSIGLLAGIIPAWSASRLNPVEAIRSK